MLLESDILRLFFTGPYLVSSPLCSGVWCWLPLRGSTPTSLFASLLSSLNCPPWSPAATALCWVASSTLPLVPLPLPDTARFHVQESFVWFRAKTDSSALAAYPHSATYSPGRQPMESNTSENSWMILFLSWRMLPRRLEVNFGPNENRTLHWSHCCFHFVLLGVFSCFCATVVLLLFYLFFLFFFLASLNGKRSWNVVFIAYNVCFPILQGTLHEGVVSYSIHIASVYSLLVPCACYCLPTGHE